MKQIDKKAQDAFFEELGASLVQPGTIYVFGGTSLLCLAMPNRLTDDIDAYSSGDAELASRLKSLAELHDWKVDDLDVAEISETPADIARAPTLYGRFGRLTVMVIDPNLTAVGKLDRAGRGDTRDLQWMFENNLLDLDLMERMIAGAKGMDNKAESILLFNKITGRNMPPPVSPQAPTPKKPRRRWPL